MRALGYFAGPQGRRAPRALDGDLSDAGQGRVAGQGRAHRRPDVSSDADDVRVPRVALGPRPTVRAGLGDGRLHVPRREGPRDVAPGDEAVQRDVAGVAQVPQPLGRRDARRPRVRASEDVAPVLDERPVGLERELRPAPLPVDAERFASRRVPLDALRRPVEHEELLVGDREAHAAVALDVLAGRDFAHSPSRQGGHRSSFFATRCAAREPSFARVSPALPRSAETLPVGPCGTITLLSQASLALRGRAGSVPAPARRGGRGGLGDRTTPPHSDLFNSGPVAGFVNRVDHPESSWFPPAGRGFESDIVAEWLMRWDTSPLIHRRR